MIGLGIDAGGSSARWLLVRGDGVVLARGSGPPVTGHSFGEADRRENLRRLRALLGDASAAGRANAVVAGVTGLEGGGEVATTYARAIAEELALPAERVRVGNDMITAYAAAYGDGSGVLVYAGTGSIAYARAANGSFERSGGHGYLIDDAGGGYAIGRDALRGVLRRRDEDPGAADGALATALYAELGGRTWEHVRREVYGGGRARVAALVPAVATAARAGDPDARAVLAAAGADLARLARVLLERTDGPYVTLMGGVARAGRDLTDALEGGLPARVRLRVLEDEPVLAAARLALAMLP